MSEQEKNDFMTRGNHAQSRSPRRRPSMTDGRPGRRPLREDVMEIDREILHLLLRRHNLLEKMRHKGRLDAAEEKILRESWQHEVARISRDAELSGRFFSLMQAVNFLPRPVSQDGGDDSSQQAGARREAFNLAPSRKPVHFSLTAPLAGNATCAWLYLGAAAGRPLALGPVLQNDPVIDCIKALNQMGAAITRDDASVIVRTSSPVQCPDRVIHVGDCEYNFYLFLAHYLGHSSRVKFTGETALKLADFSTLRHVLPHLGARLVHVVPKSNGLPARLECSGMLPAVFSFPAELPGTFAEALILAASFYEQPFGLDLAAHPLKDIILAHTVPLLEACGATFRLSSSGINLQPAALAVPASPAVPMEPQLAAFLCAFAEVLGGDVHLDGQWPNWPEANGLLEVLSTMNCMWQNSGNGLGVTREAPLDSFNLAAIPEDIFNSVPAAMIPLLVSLGASVALRGGAAILPESLAENPVATDFLASVGLEITAGGRLQKTDVPTTNPIWNAPAPAWAMALALAACARPGKAGFQLGNPGVMTELWPQFWGFYNSLPDPQPRKEPEEMRHSPARRRILTTAIAQVPELKDEDLY